METIFDINNAQAVANHLRHFNFNNNASIRDINLSAFILPLARAYQAVQPIGDHSIEIKYAGADEEALDNPTLENLAMMLQSGTKIFDAIVFMGIVAADEMETFGRLFVYTPNIVPTLANQNRSLTILTACIMVLYSRGALPGSNPSSAGQNLPKFIANMQGIQGMRTEADLYANAMSFDPKHLAIKEIMEGAIYSGWDEVVANRLNLGVAGHKPLKAIMDLNTTIPDQTITNDPLLMRLRAAATAAGGGFYLNLHPAFANLANLHQKFYHNCLFALYNGIPGSQEVKYARLAELPYFNKDSTIIGRTLHRFGASYATWDYTTWDLNLGAIQRFTSNGRTENKPLPIGLITQVGFEAPELVEQGRVIIPEELGGGLDE